MCRTTGYIGRYGWNTVTLGGAVPAGELLGALYATTVSKLPQIEAS
jgi:hypothetical protein